MRVVLTLVLLAGCVQHTPIDDAWAAWDGPRFREWVSHHRVFFTTSADLGGRVAETVVHADGAVEIVTLRTLPSWCDRSTVIAHELGHAMGLRHVEDRRSIMATTCDQMAPRPTRADLDSL